MALRNTIQRKLVLDSARQLANHPTAHEIYQHTREACPSISKGTVYRNIALLVGEGLLRRVEVPGGADRIDFNTSEHCHLLCDKCGGAFDIDVPGAAEFLGGVRGKSYSAEGYSVHSCGILLKGLCPQCNEILN